MEKSLDQLIDRLKQASQFPYQLAHIEFDFLRRKIQSHILDYDNVARVSELLISFEDNLDYRALGTRFIISKLHVSARQGRSFSQNIEYIDQNLNILSKNFCNMVKILADDIDSIIDYQRDYLFDYIGLKTLEASYLIKSDEGNPLECPQDMFMRVCVQLFLSSLTSPKIIIENIKKTYDLLSLHMISLASPILFNSGYDKGNLSSCFLLGTHESAEEKMKTYFNTTKICYSGGGVGVHLSNLHDRNIIPYIRLFNYMREYINSTNDGKRKTSIAFYLSIDHYDISDFVAARRPFGTESMRARDVFYGVWIPDLFMKILDKQGEWCLFCRKSYPDLDDVYGEEYEKLYNKYSRNDDGVRRVRALDLWNEICKSQIETGIPYLLYKDQVNLKSNQKNIGTIKSSNLCAEILLYSDNKEYAVCNLASIVLQKYIIINDDGKRNMFDFKKMYENTKYTVRLLNNLIDVNYYSTEEAKISNFKNRPIGIGVQGLADLFISMRIPFESEEARKLNREIFETLYFSALEGSMDMAIERGKPYETYEGSPISFGKFQFNLWEDCHDDFEKIDLSASRWDWKGLRENILKSGILNSTLIACMPTVSSASIIGSTESIEPIDRCIFRRVTKAGNYLVVNRNLVRDLQNIGLWSKKMCDKILYNDGKISNIEEIPIDIRQLYKTVWEMSMKTLIDYSADRAPFICMTQSLNLFMTNPNVGKLRSMHKYAFDKHLKTGMYYLRMNSATQPAKYAISHSDSIIPCQSYCSS
jgi:ribonucleoside-diphosphate reductase alpha chain